MKKFNILITVLLFLPLVLLAGCGSDKEEGLSPAAPEAPEGFKIYVADEDGSDKTAEDQGEAGEEEIAEEAQPEETEEEDGESEELSDGAAEEGAEDEDAETTEAEGEEALSLPDLTVSDIQMLSRATDTDGYDVYPVQITYANIGIKRAYSVKAKHTYDGPAVFKGTDADGNVYFYEPGEITYDVPFRPAESRLADITEEEESEDPDEPEEQNPEEADADEETQEEFEPYVFEEELIEADLNPDEEETDEQNESAEDEPAIPEPEKNILEFYYLDPGETYVYTDYIYPDRWGNITVEAVIDYGNHVREADGNNNSKTARFFVRSIDGVDDVQKAVLPESEDTSLCSNSEGGDGVYSGCYKNVITHLPTGITIKIKKYTSRYVKLYVGGTSKVSHYLYKDKPIKLTSTSGKELTVDYVKNTSDRGVFLDVRQTPQTLSDSFFCGNYFSGDGEAAVCPGNTILHNDSQMKMKAFYYNASDLTLYFYDSENYMTFSVNEPQTFILSNGYKMTVEYTGMKDGDERAFVNIASEAPLTCEDLSGDDGEYGICIGNTIVHKPTGRNFKLTDHEKDSDTDIFYFVVEIPEEPEEGAQTNVLQFNTSGFVKIRGDASNVFLLDNNYEVTLDYIKEVADSGFYFDISSRLLTEDEVAALTNIMKKEYMQSQGQAQIIPCDDSVADDGIYEICEGNMIIHRPSGVEATVASYDESQIEFFTEWAGDMTELILKKGEPVIFMSDEGVEVTFEYTKIEGDERVFVNISSVLLQPSEDDDTEALDIIGVEDVISQ